MRSAEEIVNDGFKDWVIAGQIKRHCQQLINEARKEAIIEAANVAKDDVSNGFTNPEGLKDSILSLIDELK